jgi:hypothetical protein
VTASLRISPYEGEALRELMLRRLFILGSQPLELARAECVSVDQLGKEFAEDMRLMADLGWTQEGEPGPVELTMPRESLIKTVKRLRRDARRAPMEPRHELEPKEEAPEKRWERFRRGVDACEEVLVLLDPGGRCRMDAAPSNLRHRIGAGLRWLLRSGQGRKCRRTV